MTFVNHEFREYGYFIAHKLKKNISQTHTEEHHNNDNS